MKHTALIFLLIVAAVFVVIGIFYLQKKSSSPKKIVVTTAAKPLTEEHTVTLGKGGFQPATITVNVGTSVRWINKSGQQATVNSDNYPMNQLHKELNLGVFANGSSLMHIFTLPGSYGFHDQFHHEFSGTVIVKK